MQHDVTTLVEDLVLPTLEIGAVTPPPAGSYITWHIIPTPNLEAFTTITEYGLTFYGYL
jgi:hypothetical protein